MKVDITQEEFINNVPKILYKYRNWKEDKHKSILKKQEIFMASPLSFDDKLDCNIPMRYDLLTDDQVDTIFMFNSENINPKFNKEQHKIFIQNNFKKREHKLNSKTSSEQFNKDFFKGFSERFGVMSLTAHNAEDSMWEKYGDDSKGICVGFDTNELFKYVSGGGPVQYDEKLPIILPRPFNDFVNQSITNIYHKLQHWSFEKEYRIHKMSYNPLSNNERIIKLSPNVFKELILGKNMTNEQKEDVRNSIPDCLKHIKITEQYSLS